MAVSLSKGQGVSLTKENPSLNKIIVGLGWDVRKTDGASFDLDASAFLLGDDDKVYEQPGIVGYLDGCSTGGNGSVTYSGDNRDGAGEGDDETLSISLNDLPEAVKKVVFAVTIHNAVALGQNFGGIEQSYVRVLNEETQEVLCQFDLREDYDIETAMLLGELYRHDGGWKFRALGQGFADGLEGLCKAYSVELK